MMAVALLEYGSVSHCTSTAQLQVTKLLLLYAQQTSVINHNGCAFV